MAYQKVSSAETAIGCIGCGYDISDDLRLKYCKGQPFISRLIEIDNSQSRDIVLPGGILIPNVSKSIKCDKGERTRFRSDMSEQFNQEISLSGKIPSGLFNTMFEFSGCWQKDAANTKTLAFDGVFITLYTVALEKTQMILCDHVKHDVPSAWDPAALARFIDKFGTHVVVGMKMGGKDVIYLRQQHQSTLQPADVQKKLKEIADKRFSDSNGQYSLPSEPFHGNNELGIKEQRLRFADTSPSSSYSLKEDIVTIYKRRGGSDVKGLSHYEWLPTVQSDPDVISMSFIPITSLLNDKPPIAELHQFLEFQLPRQWAPVFSDLPLGPRHRKPQSSASLQFSFMGPKLYVNTSPVDVGKRPVTGLRLYLEGKRSNHLAIHLQHLSTLPKIFELRDDPNGNFRQESYDRRYYEKVQWRHFSHVCTAPVEADGDLSIVTGAQLHVEEHGMKNVLFLRLRFATVMGAMLAKHPEWDGSPSLARKSGLISTLISHHFTTAQKPPPRPADVNINSAIYPGGPPVPVQSPKLLKFVDTTEMTRGPQETPGYWVVSGAKLMVEKGKISLRVKYSLLAVILPDDEIL
ncbi:Membrane attack complex component/perforin (MACPF) domain [Dillenia turbinata]|uniref:Membrane attack complex component/perforin (MACPF) domain n=1 Tax=Dillenia turbinata TaxID=194707 RepID=A0AAN8UKV8_9MAGN